jgi:hypothetical protein
MATTEILQRPLTREQLLAMSGKHNGRVRGVIAVAWHDLLGREQEAFEEECCRRVTGSRYGLVDLSIRVAGCLGDEILLEVGGDVTHLLADYDLAMAEEASAGQGERLHGVDVGKVVGFARERIVQLGLDREVCSFAGLSDHANPDSLLLRDDRHFADGTPLPSLAPQQGMEVIRRVQAVLDAWLMGGEARREAEGGNDAS